jgi:hypothetical protein
MRKSKLAAALVTAIFLANSAAFAADLPGEQFVAAKPPTNDRYTGIKFAVDSAGNIFTANMDSNNVTKITSNGISSIFGITGTAPLAIVIDSKGNVFTSNTGSNNVSKLSPDGNARIFGTTGSVPKGITVDCAGNIYTTSVNDNNVSVISSSGRTAILGLAGNTPYQIIYSKNFVYTTNFLGNNVSKIKTVAAANRTCSDTDDDRSLSHNK